MQKSESLDKLGWPKLTFAGGVQQGSLEAHVAGLSQVVLYRHLHAETSVRVHVGQGQQVRRSHKKVAVERVYADPCKKKKKKQNNIKVCICVDKEFDKICVA